ncbi:MULTISPECIES: adenylate/guanylate cyclase domain-containing protein [unclassified Acinetobacter]|uniref:adenylate/guanylate cyclase domain-containing protein n=1 Tax=unclassified Acinetobacter TaxID=196816 RepID=UPI0025754285|nr:MULTISPECIES: adenylate/guanylate cyclase domain-containing protein [unclassified Acinetobacter]MDM1758063.1 adenylate/guanylate cyclase domain-containing protein [Acinetobacter sp. 256-1]MDM1761196.1 adenylate/guanylate cyclase domain-containing protein [Acinetobacter sp. 251-1]
MPLDRMLDKQPKQFEIFQRLMGYSILAMLLVIYSFTTPNAYNQLYVPIFIFFILLISPRLSRWLEYQYGALVRRNVYFLIDIIVISTVLAAVYLSLVITFILLFVIIYIAVNYKISMMISSLAILISIILFYLNIIFVFGFDDYFQQTSIELTIFSFIGLIIFINIANYYQNRRIKRINTQRQNYFNEMNRYIQLSNQLSRYAPLQLWQSIMRGETEAKLEYKRKKITVFFSDIQGFTELSETLIPDDLAFVLNDYLSHMTEIAKQYGATIDKFMGDAILIFFGDPDSQGVEQDAKNCLDMALAMRQQMKFLRARWEKMGYAPLHIRMGISTGYCHVGNYGAMHRMAYTIVGRDANLAARLQSAAEIDEILISDETYKLVKSSYLCAPKEPMELKGIQDAVKTWQVMEKYSNIHNENEQWFDYEYKGFHLVLNMQEVQNFEYTELVSVLEKMIERIQLQQQLTNSMGVAQLNSEDEIIIPPH